jgi:CheY-like chemotaxis protein
MTDRLDYNQGWDLVLCDMLMPKKEGLETIRELRSQFPQVKIVAMCGDSKISSAPFLDIGKAFRRGRHAGETI